MEYVIRPSASPRRTKFATTCWSPPVKPVELGDIASRIERTSTVSSAGIKAVLTQSADVELQNRVFSEEIWLAATDSPENWKDISIEEAEQLKKQQEELANTQPTEEDRGEGATL